MHYVINTYTIYLLEYIMAYGMDIFHHYHNLPIVLRHQTALFNIHCSFIFVASILYCLKLLKMQSNGIGKSS